MTTKTPQQTPRQRSAALILVVTLAGTIMLVAAAVILTLVTETPAAPVTTAPPTAAQPALQDTSVPVSGRPTLPPTWTPRPTVTTVPRQTTVPATKTQPTTIPSTPFASPDPARLQDTYWYGDGYSSMTEAEVENGTYFRFALFPVSIWIGAFGDVVLGPVHEQAISNALVEMGRVVPVQRVDVPTFAHIRMWLMTDAEFDENAACDAIDLKVGCAQTIHTDAGIMLVTGWLRVTDECFDQTLLHELTHALGIRAHSPHPEDMMYFIQTCREARYSPRDLATLRTLYSAPPYDPRGNATTP